MRILHLRGVLNFFLCFRSELATDEVVLHGTIRVDSKIRSQNVHFHDSFGREQTLAAAKLFLSLTRINFAAVVSSRAVRISSKPVRVFPAPITSTRTALIRDLFSYGFPRNCARGRTGHMINIDYFIESATYGYLFTSCKTLENERVSAANERVFQSLETSE